jgi:endonuclease III
LLAINGVGPGTADAVLLALGHPCFPVDPGIYRVLVRHGWCDITAEYDEASECLGRHAGADPNQIERLARGLSRVARKFCGVRAPRCQSCPLRPLLPESGPIDPQC